MLCTAGVSFRAWSRGLYRGGWQPGSAGSKALATVLHRAADSNTNGAHDSSGTDPADSAESSSTPAHLSYDPHRVEDMATLVLMARSAADSKYKRPQFWRACSLRAQRFLMDSALNELAQFVEAVATATHRDDELMYNFGDAVVDRIDGVDADVLGTALRAHALLGFRNDRVLGRLEALLLEMMQESRVTASGLAASIWSFAKLYNLQCRAMPATELLDATGRMVTEHVSFFSVQQLCEVLEAFAIYPMRGDHQTSLMLAGISGMLAREMRHVSAVQCASAAHAFAKCRVHDERLLLAVGRRLRDREVRDELGPQDLAHVLYGLAKFTCQDTALLDILSIEVRRRLHLMDVPMISSTLASLAKTGISSQVLTSRAAVQLRRAEPEALDAASIPELTTLAMAFGKLQARDQKLFEVFAEALLRQPDGLLVEQQCEELVNIIHAFTKVHVAPPKLFRLLAQALFERFDEITPQDVVKLLHGIAKVEYVLPLGLQDRIGEALQASIVQKLSVFELLKVSTATRRLGLEIPAVEAQLSAVLPHEAKSQGEFSMARKRTPVKERRKSARKRKWTW